MWAPFKWLAVAMSDARDSRDDELVLTALSNAWGPRWQTVLEIRAIAGISRPRATAALLRLQRAGEVHEREGYWATPMPESWNPAAADAKDAGLSNVVPLAPDDLKARMLNVLGAGKESALDSTTEPKTALTELALDELARELHWEMERLDPSDIPDWEDLTERQRMFYRLCVEHLMRQPEARAVDQRVGT